jgi:UDP-glucose 4-epimerase
MTTLRAWVVGQGGLLGAQLRRALTDQLPAETCWRCPVPQFAWQDSVRLADQLRQAVTAFAETVAREAADWAILWAAGAGVVGTGEEALAGETRTWQMFLQLLGQHLTGRRGLIVLASSAGGVYGNNPEQPLTETSSCAPFSPYGRTKLAQEQALRDWAGNHSEVSFLIARIANLYGLDQKLTKPQGVIAHMSRCLIFNRPIHVYVPLDTIRDYVLADECADHMVRCLLRLEQETRTAGQPCGVVKIFASEQEVSLAQIIGAFRTVANRSPKLICANHTAGRQQPRRLQFRSVVWRGLKVPPSTSLPIGIHRLYQHQLALYRQGRLPPP